MGQVGARGGEHASRSSSCWHGTRQHTIQIQRSLQHIFKEKYIPIPSACHTNLWLPSFWQGSCGDFCRKARGRRVVTCETIFILHSSCIRFLISNPSLSHWSKESLLVGWQRKDTLLRFLMLSMSFSTYSAFFQLTQASPAPEQCKSPTTALIHRLIKANNKNLFHFLIW